MTTTLADVPLYVVSENAASERRITPSWTISQLKTKLEPITGIPPGCQRLSVKATKASPSVAVEAADEESTQLVGFNLTPYGELHVRDLAMHLHAFIWETTLLTVLSTE